jgi:predicted small lipoprotein YifL
VILIVKSILDAPQLRAFPLAAILLVSLGACGQKGPLYMPTRPAAAVPAAPAPAAAPAPVLPETTPSGPVQVNPSESPVPAVK